MDLFFFKYFFLHLQNIRKYLILSHQGKMPRVICLLRCSKASPERLHCTQGNRLIFLSSWDISQPGNKGNTKKHFLETSSKKKMEYMTWTNQGQLHWNRYNEHNVWHRKKNTSYGKMSSKSKLHQEHLSMHWLTCPRSSMKTSDQCTLAE